MRWKNENFRLSTHVRLLPLILDSKLGYMDLNAKYEKLYYDVLLRSTTIDPNKDIS
jgi:hypothetical protein